VLPGIDEDFRSLVIAALLCFHEIQTVGSHQHFDSSVAHPYRIEGHRARVGSREA
jgi:hypothetical protein